MIGAALALLLAQAQLSVGVPIIPPQQIADAGNAAPVLTVESLYAACPDAPLAVAVDGGYFTPEGRARRQSCQITACENFAAGKLADESGTPAGPGVVLGVAGAGVGLIIVGVLIGFFIPHSTHP